MASIASNAIPGSLVDFQVPAQKSGMDQVTLSNAIRTIAQAYLSRGLAGTLREINAGHCHQFADDVLRVIEQSEAIDDADDIGLQAIGIANLMTPADDGDFNDGYPLDRELLGTHWPKVQPPDGLDWDDLDRLSEDAEFSAATHSWIAFEGRHYDAEAPDGVDNLFHLPFFVRVVESWKLEGPNAPAQRLAGMSAR